MPDEAPPVNALSDTGAGTTCTGGVALEACANPATVDNRAEAMGLLWWAATTAPTSPHLGEPRLAGVVAGAGEARR